MQLRFMVEAALFGVAFLAFTAFTAFTATAGGSDVPSDGHAELDAAVAYLWAAQSDDGGWHSDTYAFFRSGEALTPFVLHALIDLPRAPTDGIDRALGFIRDRVADTGVVGMDDPIVLAYPNYATAYSLRCLVAADDEADAERIASMRDYLIGQQFTEATGFSDSTVVYGGWGFGGLQLESSAGHMDLSYTRHVLQSLVEVGAADEEITRRARRFLQLMQKRPNDLRPQPPNGVTDAPYDGGFYFTPVVYSANKAGIDGAFRSYGTATAEGVVALHLAGVSSDDPRMRDAADWLRQRPGWGHVAGIPLDDANGWSDALHFYHHAVRAEALDVLGWTDADRRAAVDSLSPLQRLDGSFLNDRNHLMKENDPILATTLAVIALSRASAEVHPPSR